MAGQCDRHRGIDTERHGKDVAGRAARDAEEPEEGDEERRLHEQKRADEGGRRLVQPS